MVFENSGLFFPRYVLFFFICPMATHVVYLSYDGLTDPLGASQVLPYILGIEKSGYRYTVISFEKPERFGAGEASIRKQLEDKNIRWIPLTYHKSPPVFSTLWDVNALKNALKRVYAEDAFQFLHCRGYITPLAGLMAKRKWGVPFIFDMRGFFADERADAGMWKKDHLLYGSVYRYFKQKEKEFLREAAHTVVLTHAGKKIIQSGGLTGNPQHIPLSVIPCCADMDFFDYSGVDSDETISLRNQLGAEENTFILGYSGSVGTWYMLDEMMQFYKKVLELRPDSLFLFLTRDDSEILFEKAKEYGVPPDKIKVQSVTREKMPAWLSVFHASVFFILPSFSKQASSPTKQGELMGMGIPVVCNKGVGDTEEIVLNSQSGIVVNELGDQGLAQAAKQCLASTFDRELIRKNGIEVYSLESGIKSYLAIYSDLPRE